ncbi:solute carrier, putative [Ixodes scapularis]|uniref:Solute carrier, putative n=1 Tax=Ixodes scapularis TaxID=6945 RepID=B7QME2_IXOSC|nr:solute carrier, putative [Ixodes scapularis]|eukprot:XP_002416347.1 solute carrier, putative [Ixodes scapularis]
MIVTFLGTLIMAIAIEESCLHQRIALGALCLLGTGVKMLVFGLMAISMFLSMWINNIAITAMMMPVVDSLSQELLSYRKDDHAEERDTELDSLTVTPEDPEKGSGCANGLVYINGEYEGRAPVDYATWLFFALPITLVGTVLIFLLVVPVFFRCRRPEIDEDGGVSAMNVIRRNYASLGPIRFHEVAVLLLFTLLVFLWLFRDPMFARGWATFFSITPEIDEDGGVSAMNVIRRNYASLGPIRFHELAVLLLFTLLVFLWLFRDPMFARGWATFFSIT